jgi:hypothetical protein
MKLDDLCETLERLPFPRGDEPAHPERAAVLATRERVGEAVADDEFLTDCLAHELRLVESGRPRVGLEPFFVLPRSGVRLAFGHWAPGASPGPHEHTAWTLTAVCRNALEVLTFDRDESYRRCELVPKRRFPALAGRVGVVYHPCIHEPRNASREWTLSLHVTSPLDGRPCDDGAPPVRGLAAPLRVDPRELDHPYAHVTHARQRQVYVRQLVRVLATVDSARTLRAPWLLGRCFALASSATRRAIHAIVPQPGARQALAGPWLLARIHPRLVLDARVHDDVVALGVEAPGGRREELVTNAVAREALAVVAREPVFDVRSLPGPLAPEERSALGEALERTGLFRRLWQ